MTIDIPDQPRTLAEKVWADHLVVKGENGEPDLIYIDLHLVHEDTSPQAFDGLRAEGRPQRRSVSIWVRLVRSAIGLSMSSVGVL